MERTGPRRPCAVAAAAVLWLALAAMDAVGAVAAAAAEEEGQAETNAAAPRAAQRSR